MLEIAKSLVARGHSLTVYCLSMDEELVHLPAVTRVRIVRRPWGPKLITGLRLFVGATLALRKSHHDVVCVLGPCALPKGRFLFFGAFCQAGWRASWRYSGGRPDVYGRVYAYVHGTLEETVVGRADGLVAMSVSTADELKPMLKGQPGIWISPGGVDVDEFSVPDDHTVALLRKRWGIPSNAFVIAFVGEFITPRKGLIPLALSLDGLDGVVILVRGAGDATLVQRLLDEKGCSTIIRFIGEGPAEDAYQASDVAAIPSLYEPFSLVAMEAASTGLPVVISHVAGAASYIGAAGAGISIDPLDGSSIRKAIETLSRDPDLVRAMGDRARGLALEMDWPAVSRTAVDAIESLGKHAPDMRQQPP